MSKLLLRKFSSSGTILISVLWVVIILTILAISLGRRAHIESTLVKHALGQVKSNYLAWAGMAYALQEIDRDSQDPLSLAQDTLYRCAFQYDRGGSPEDLFKARAMADGYFSVEYVDTSIEQKGTLYYGPQDEERRININALTIHDIPILSALIVGLGFDERVATTIAHAVLDWKDEDDITLDTATGAEDDYYQSLSKPYRCKDRPFDAPAELLLVRAMTQEIYQAMAKYVTVFPKTGFLQVNFDTAPAIVLTALARGMVAAFPDMTVSNADTLVEKILRYRQGEDGVIMTSDDRVIDLNVMPLNSQERNLFLAMSRLRTSTSNYLRVRVKGVENARAAQTVIEAVVYRYDLSLLSWHRN